jgi:predicted nucleic acid-binding protein
MIVVDTNVISELMRGEPHPAVLAWVGAQPRAQLYTTYINQAEILYGIGALPEGRRRVALIAAAEAMFAEDFAGRILRSAWVVSQFECNRSRWGSWQRKGGLRGRGLVTSDKNNFIRLIQPYAGARITNLIDAQIHV